MATPDASGITWDDEAPAPVASAPTGIAWDDEQAGPPRADFTGTQAGSASVPMAQFDTPWNRVKRGAAEIADNLRTGFGAIVEGGDYPPEDTRRVMSPQEGFGRELAEATTGVARIAYDYGTPFGVTTKLAEDLGAPAVDPFRRGLEAQEQAVAVNPETMRYQSPRIEAAASGLANLAAGYVPEAKIARAVDEVLAPGVRAAMDAAPDAALAGHLGPDAQGVALGDEIAASAGLHEAAASRRSAAEVDAAARDAAEVPGETGVAVPEAPAAGPASIERGATETPEATDVTPEEMAAFQRQQQIETPTAEPTAEELAAFERQRAPQQDLIENNASGESAASLEAQHRIADERAAGQTRAVIDSNGEIRPLLGVDAVDTHARPGQVIVQRGIGRDEWTILSHGDNLPPELARSRVNASRRALDELHAEETAHASPVRSDQGPPAVRGEVPEGGRADRRGDLQQPQARGSEAGRPELRQPEADGSVRQSEPATVAPERVTGIKHAKVAEERALKGLDEVTYEGKRTFGDAWDRARAKLDETPDHGEALAHSVIERPRALNAEESAALIQDRARLHNEHRAAMAEIATAQDAGDVAAETAARGRLRNVEDAIEVNDRASRASGHEQGFGLAARRLMSREDYSMAELVVRAKVAKGETLTAAERTHIEAIGKRLEAAEQRIAELESKRPGRRAARTHDKEFDDLTTKLKSIQKEKHVICAT